MPLIQTAIGFKSATITNYGPETWFPGTSTTNADRFLVCSQVGSPLDMPRNTTYTNKSYFQCVNNWNYPVSVQLSLVNGNTVIDTFSDVTPFTIASGATGCLMIDSIKTLNFNNRTRTVLWRATAITAGGDRTIDAEFHFTSVVRTANAVPDPPEC